MATSSSAHAARFAQHASPLRPRGRTAQQLKSALIPWHAGIAVRTGYRGEMRYGLLNDLRALDEKALPRIVERYAALAQPDSEALRRPLPAAAPRHRIARRSRPRWRSSASTRRSARRRHSRPAPSTAPPSVGPRAISPTSRAPSPRAAGQVWLLGSAKDAPITAQIRSLAGEGCVDLAGRTSLDEAIDLLAGAAHVVTNDSGLMHVAAALDRPMAAIFGSSSPEFTPPLSAHARVISLRLSCSPCFARDLPARPHQLPRAAGAGAGAGHARRIREIIPPEPRSRAKVQPP